MATAIAFRAPWSRSLRTASIISSTLLGAVFLAGVIAMNRGEFIAGVILLVLPAAILLGAASCTVRGYVLSETAITVERLGWHTHLPLATLQSVSGDAQAMQGALRLLGNGGLFSYSGEFWSRRLGRFRALATDPLRAVVLRYPKRTIVITPHDPQAFIMRARTLLKTAHFPT